MVTSAPVPLAATAPVPSDERCDSSAATPGGIGSHVRPVVTPSTCVKTISSGKSAIGSTAPSRARRTRSASTPACAGATRAISSWTSSTVSRPKSAPKRAASSWAMRQSSIVVPSGVMRRAWRITRPSRLVVVPLFSPHTEVGRNTSARAAASSVNAPTATTNFTASSTGAHADAVGEVLLEVGAEQHQRVDRARRRGLEDAGGVEPGLGGHAAPRVGVLRRGRRRG